MGCFERIPMNRIYGMKGYAALDAYSQNSEKIKIAEVQRRLDKKSRSIGFHERVAIEAFDNHEIYCKTCDKVYQPTTEEFASYLANGWPKCDKCKIIMIIRRKK